MPDPFTKNALPPLWTLRRQIHCLVLAAGGMLQAVLTIVLSLACSRLLAGETQLWTISLTPLIASTTLATFALAVWQYRSAEAFALSYVHVLRMKYMEHVMLQPLKKGDQGIGLIMARIVNDMSAIKLWLSRGLVTFVTSLPMLVTLLVWSFYYAQAITLPLVAMVSLWFCLVGLALLPLSRSIRLTRKRRGAIAGFAGKVLHARTPLLLHGKISSVLARMDRRSNHLSAAMRYRALWSGLLRASGRASFPFAVLVQFTQENLPGAGATALFLMISAMVAAQLTMLASGIEYLEASRVATGKIASILSRPAIGDISLRTMAPPKDACVLSVTQLCLPSGRRISFRIDPGTIARLPDLQQPDYDGLVQTLLRLNGPQQAASIELVGSPLLQMNPKQVWKHIALVSPLNGLTTFQKSVPPHALGARAKRPPDTALRSEIDTNNEDINAQEMDLRKRLIRALLRKPRLVIIHEPGLHAMPTAMNAFLQELRQLGTSAIILEKEEIKGLNLSPLHVTIAD